MAWHLGTYVVLASKRQGELEVPILANVACCMHARERVHATSLPHEVGALNARVCLTEWVFLTNPASAMYQRPSSRGDGGGTSA